MTAATRHILTPAPAAALGVPPWQPAVPLPPAVTPSACDVLIVGAGITGLAAAISIAGTGRHVTVIDRAFGTGATARSGGVVLGDTLVGPAPDFVDCDGALRTWIVESGARCDLFWYGCAELARDESLARQPIDWRDEGAVRLAAWVSGGVLDPVKFQQALLEAARQAGSAIVDGVTVIALTSHDSDAAVLTDRGEIGARQVIMAVDATARATEFDPWGERLITAAVQTEPLSEAALASLGLNVHHAFYTRDLPLLWGRVMPDRSLIVGRETLECPRQDREIEMLPSRFAEASARLAARVRGLHGRLKDIEVCRAWGGPIARSASGLPAIVGDPDHPRVLWAGGYGGQGVAQAFRIGRLAADRLCLPVARRA